MDIYLQNTIIDDLQFTVLSRILYRPKPCHVQPN